jgi:mannose-6-phosphate isomerase-like protein (cupin superfamily)
MAEHPIVRKAAEVTPVDCPCGEATRIITAADNDKLSVHRVRIEGEAKLHYHEQLTECYVVLEGEGAVELNDVRHDVAPGDVIYIPPGTRHAMRGRFTILNIVVPPFDEADETILE